MSTKTLASDKRKKTASAKVGGKQKQNNQQIGVPDGTVGGCEYPTPNWLASFLVAFFKLNLDVAANAANAKCLRYFTALMDGLAQVWNGRVFMNPPYDRKLIGVWMQKAYESVMSGDSEIAVCLVPVRTGSKWWQRWVSQRENCEVIWLDSRIRFGGAKGSAAFDSAVVVIRKPGHHPLDVRSLARILKELRDENQLKAKQKMPNKLKIAA